MKHSGRESELIGISLEKSVHFSPDKSQAITKCFKGAKIQDHPLNCSLTQGSTHEADTF